MVSQSLSDCEAEVDTIKPPSFSYNFKFCLKNIICKEKYDLQNKEGRVVSKQGQTACYTSGDAVTS